MKTIERKVLQKINENGIDVYKVEEMVYNTSKTEMKKSYPEESHFQSDKYFAKKILSSLTRMGFLKKEGNKFFKVKK